jgi:hypothetical protein
MRRRGTDWFGGGGYQPPIATQEVTRRWQETPTIPFPVPPPATPGIDPLTHEPCASFSVTPLPDEES